MRRRAFLVAGAATALSGTACGFRPRGSGTAAGPEERLYIDADRGLSVLPELRLALADRGFALAPNRDEADVLLRIGGERVQERIVSVQRTGRVSEFELAHELSLAIARATDEASPAVAVDVPANLVRVTRDYTWDVREVLGKENEARILRLELRRELVRQVVLRTLASLGAYSSRPVGPS